MVSEGAKSLEVKKQPQKIDHSDTKSDDVETNSDKLSKPKTLTAENTEQAPEVSTSTADAVSPKKSSEDTALILSAEDEAAELCATANEEAVTEQPKPVNVPKPKKLKKDGSKSLWVSNISRSTKASDLKKLFSASFKVESAKIVTNGKSFFGYISLETAEMVQKAVKDLNAFNLAGRAISVSFLRPDLKAARASVGEQMKRGGKQKQLTFTDNQKATENKQEEKTDSSKNSVKGGLGKAALSESNDEILEKTVEKKAENKVIKSNPEEKQRKSHRQEIKVDRKDTIIKNLEKELNTANSELRINKRRLRDSENRLEFERSRKSELISEMSKLEAQIKMERRKMEQEREQAEKQRKIDQSRFEDDKRIINKELDECKKLREYLQTKVDEMKIRHRSRSPIRRSPVRRAGPSGRSLPGHGGMDKMERSRMLHISPPKQRGYDASQNRQCIITPSPPKINKRSPARRSRERSPPYKGIKKARMDYATSYSSGPSGGIKGPLGHYTPESLNAPPRGTSWTPSYKVPYRYTSAPGQSAYPLVGGEVMNAARFNSARPEYHEYNKRVTGVPRKY